MRALVYHGSHEVQVDTVADPHIQEPDDIIVQVTSTAICGSDLHLYRGKVPGMKEGDILGHEFMGHVIEAGPQVHNLRVGERVVVPFVIACGHCFFCKFQLYSSCETTNTNARPPLSTKKHVKPGAALFGFTHMYGGMPGGQAQFVRVPKANVGPIRIPAGLDDEQVLFLSDILPTAYQAVLNAGVTKGSSVAIFGAGPVGLLCCACARLLEAEHIFIVDHHPYRLEFARMHYGALPINFDHADPAEVLLEQTHGRGVDGVIDAIGFEAKGNTLETVLTNLKVETSSGAALRQCITAVRRGGFMSVPGVYTGFIHGFLFGDVFEKALTIRGGQTNVQRFLPELLGFIMEGKLVPNLIISHRMPLERAADGYRLFDRKEDHCRKVVLTAS
ncbi:zinc-dependent alcohol dehydrogenase [Massilia sp. TS11]|uniref:zinc-dependent alcohol dehydrogenase n=1 Tax=Massilia sp. TS11 TaxID=2908003 RepID=UPI001ED9D6D0|nr:zinc-dependent alcohol dehydrogenase [Massilia sp. TS11]MCG2586043.1 glutathione-dependent formaldehyde dehydrogenase [Massilia sp. TS11]